MSVIYTLPLNEATPFSVTLPLNVINARGLICQFYRDTATNLNIRQALNAGGLFAEILTATRIPLGGTPGPHFQCPLTGTAVDFAWVGAGAIDGTIALTDEPLPPAGSVCLNEAQGPAVALATVNPFTSGVNPLLKSYTLIADATLAFTITLDVFSENMALTNQYTSSVAAAGGGGLVIRDIAPGRAINCNLTNNDAVNPLNYQVALYGTF